MRSSLAPLFVRQLAACGVVLAAAAGLMASSPVHARPKKPPKLIVVVLPFGEGDVLSQGIEKAIGKRKDAAISAQSKAVADAVDAAGSSAFEPAKLAAILARKGGGVDVLVRLRATTNGLALTAYAKDGLPRVQQDLSVDNDPETIKAVVAALDPALAEWAQRKPLPMGASSSSSSSDEPAAHADDEDGGGGGAHGPLASVAAAAGDERAKPKKKRHASIDDDADASATTKDAEGSSEASSATNESSGEAKESSSEANESSGGSEKKAHESIDDIEASAKKKADASRHAVAFSGGLDIGTWHWTFDGGGDARLAQEQHVPLYPGLSAMFDVWPLSFAGIRFIGVDAEIAGALVPYTLVGTRVAPQEFTSPTIRAGAMLKLRYTFDGGVGVGVRAGYRTAIGGSAVQKASVGGVVHDVTAVPAYRLRAFATGLELFVPIELGAHPLEIEARLEALPLATYEEAPDNPGATSLGYGGAGLVAARYVDTSGAFFEARLEGLGVYASFTDAGTRKVIVDNALVDTAGGNEWNISGAATLGAGFEF